MDFDVPENKCLTATINACQEGKIGFWSFPPCCCLSLLNSKGIYPESKRLVLRVSSLPLTNRNSYFTIVLRLTIKKIKFTIAGANKQTVCLDLSFDLSRRHFRENKKQTPRRRRKGLIFRIYEIPEFTIVSLAKGGFLAKNHQKQRKKNGNDI